MICYLGAIYYSSLSIPEMHMCPRASDKAPSLPGEYMSGSPAPAACCRQGSGAASHCLCTHRNIRICFSPRKKHGDAQLCLKPSTSSEHGTRAWCAGTRVLCLALVETPAALEASLESSSTFLLPKLTCAVCIKGKWPPHHEPS